MWDPFARKLTPEMLLSSTTERYAAFVQNFARNQARRKKLLTGTGVLACVLLVFTPILHIPNPVPLILLGLLGIVAAYPFFVVKQLERAILLEAACRKLGWTHVAGDPHGTAGAVATYFPLTKAVAGAHGQRLSEQFWGTFDTTPFWRGTYQYTTGSGKNQTTHVSYLYAVQLERPTQHPFAISPPIHMKGRRIRSESVEFNRQFTIHFAGEHAEGGHAFFKAIPPSAMEYLLEIDKAYGNFSVEIRSTTALISMDAPLGWKPSVTNFLKSPEVAPEDVTSFAHHLTEIPSKLCVLSTLLD